MIVAPIIKFGSKYNEHRLFPGEFANLSMEHRLLPSDFANTHLKLVPGGYDSPGKLTLKPYQIEPVNAIVDWWGKRRIAFQGPTRTAKSMMTEVVMFWGMRYLNINGVVCYSEHDTVSLVFRTRIAEMIRGNKILRELWDGVDDNLTVKNILLRNCMWRATSAQDLNDLASTGAGFVIGSEVSKWQKKKDNAILKLYGRQDSTPEEFRRSIIETSPYEVGDMFHESVYRPGTIVLQPHYPCPICGEYQVFDDSNIKLRREEVEDHSKQAAMLRDEKEKAVVYRCPHCQQEIKERDRRDIDARVIWAAPAQVAVTRKRVWEQHGETIDKSGNVSGLPRTRYDMVCFNWNRSVDIENFTWYEWLARFFDACHRPQMFHTYENETNSRFWEPVIDQRTEVSTLEAKRGDYYMRPGGGNNDFVPDDVLIVTAGIDSQDKEFYYVLVGWGAYKSAYILRYGTIYCPMLDIKYTDRTVLLNTFREGFIGRNAMQKSDGTIMPIRLALIDRGGHRKEDVDLLTANIPILQGYVGLTRNDPKKRLVYRSHEGPFYMAQAERLSEEVSNLIDSDNFHIPWDSGLDFMKQILNHFHTIEADKWGNEKTVWHKIRPDHYRSCLNMAYGTGELLNFDTLLNDERVVASLVKNPEPKEEPVPEVRHRPPGDERVGAGYFALNGERRF